MLPAKDTAVGGLVGVEYVWQGLSVYGGILSNPGKMSQYFNPSRDYVCQVSEFEEDNQADWQEDKEWLKATPEEQRDPYQHESREVLEYAQTAQGQWYARKIRKETRYSRSGTGGFEVITLIHVDTERDIPEEIMDPESVTAETLRAPEGEPSRD